MASAAHQQLEATHHQLNAAFQLTNTVGRAMHAISNSAAQAVADTEALHHVANNLTQMAQGSRDLLANMEQNIIRERQELDRLKGDKVAKEAEQAAAAAAAQVCQIQLDATQKGARGDEKGPCADRGGKGCG